MSADGSGSSATASAPPTRSHCSWRTSTTPGSRTSPETCSSSSTSCRPRDLSQMRSDFADEHRGRLSVAAIALALCAPLLTRLRPNRLCRVLQVLAGHEQGTAALSAPVTARIERSLAVAARVRPQTCLTRGVTRYVLLRRAGLPVELVFGLGSHTDVYAGHCWLELEQEPYLETQDPRRIFPEVFRISGATSA